MPNKAEEPQVHAFTGIQTPVKREVKLTTVRTAIPDSTDKNNVFKNFPSL